MRLAPLLLIAAVIVFGVVGYRLMTGGPPGAKTAAVAALGIGLLVAGLLARRREHTVVTTSSGTGTRP